MLINSDIDARQPALLFVLFEASQNVSITVMLGLTFDTHSMTTVNDNAHKNSDAYGRKWIDN